MLYLLQKAIGWTIIHATEWVIKRFSDSPPVFDAMAYPLTAELQEHWQALRDEYFAYCREHEPRRMSEVFREQEKIAPKGNWLNVMLRFYSYEVPHEPRFFQRSREIIERYPLVTSAMFSVIPNGKRIKPHRGPYKGLLRFHLGLKIPDSPDCYMILDGKKIHWQEGGVILFDDTYEHEVRNQSGEERIILFIDYLRPLPFPINGLNKLVYKLMRISPFIRKVVENHKKR